MSVWKRRKQAKKVLANSVSNLSQTLVIHYSQQNIHDSDDDLSSIITSITVRSLDNTLNECFAIHLEADTAGYLKEQISDVYKEMEYVMLLKYNNFVKRHKNCIWIHWNMVNVNYGFQAIRHRYAKLNAKAEGDYFEIPSNKRVDLQGVLVDMYGEKFVVGNDNLESLIKINNNNLPHQDYLSSLDEATQFSNGNFQSLLKSQEAKVNFIAKAVLKLKDGKLKVANKNGYAVFLDIISHPIFNLIGWVATIAGAIAGIIALIMML